MHDAYEVATVLEKLPLTIDSITSYENVLLVGTHLGQVLVYKVISLGGSKFDVRLDYANKTFSKKPIPQLEAIPDFEILLSLTDNVVTVHELASLKITKVLEKTRGATAFSAYVQEITSIDGRKQRILRLCVAVRKKLMLFYWKASLEKRGFKQLREDLIMPDTPKNICWCKNSVCVGFRKEYYIVNIDDGESKPLFPTGRTFDPLINRIDDTQLALRKDNLTILIDYDGKATQKYSVTWSENPVGVLYSSPYLIGILPKIVEIRSIEPRSLIQVLELDRPRFISLNSDGVIYVASTTAVWRLTIVPIDQQIKELVDSKEFELALQVANAFNMKSEEVQKIENLHAFALFATGKFDESLKLFCKLSTDPSHIVGLYPDMLPAHFHSSILYPGTLPPLKGSELEKSLAALIDYLTEKRRGLQKIDQADGPGGPTEDPVQHHTPIMDGGKTIKTSKELSKIIDTTLLKCYLEINDALVAPLLRLPDNSCHVEESEKVLRRKEKWSELIILYETKGKHKKALDMLKDKSQSSPSSDPLGGPDRTIEYLQHLGNRHLNIIKEYSIWVLKKDPEKGLQIFIDDISDVENLPRKEVLAFLLEQSTKDQLIIPYLKHIIHEWRDETSEFHEQLINSYREKINPMLVAYIDSLPEGQSAVEAGTEGGDLGELRGELLEFLQSSQCYRAEILIRHFPYEYFYEERAILHGRCKQHKQALSIYVYLLHRLDKATDYCRLHYNPQHPNDSEVYLHLLSLYLQPVEANFQLLYDPRLRSNNTTPRIKEAMKLLHHHSSRLDCQKALSLLPNSATIRDLLPFLESVIEQQERNRRKNKIIKNLLLIEKLSTERARIAAESVSFSVTDVNNCQKCQGKISNSSFARTPSGKLLHYYCMNRDEV